MVQDEFWVKSKFPNAVSLFFFFRCVSTLISAKFTGAHKFTDTLALFGLVKFIGVLYCPIWPCLAPYSHIGKIGKIVNMWKIWKYKRHMASRNNKIKAALTLFRGGQKGLRASSSLNFERNSHRMRL